MFILLMSCCFCMLKVHSIHNHIYKRVLLGSRLLAIKQIASLSLSLRPSLITRIAKSKLYCLISFLNMNDLHFGLDFVHSNIIGTQVPFVFDLRQGNIDPYIYIYIEYYTANHIASVRKRRCYKLYGKYKMMFFILCDRESRMYLGV